MSASGLLISSRWPRTLCLDTAARSATRGWSRCPTPGESSRRVAGDIHLLSTPLCMRLQTCLLRCRAASHPLIQTGSVANDATPMSSASRLTRAGASATIAAVTTTNTGRSSVRKRSSSTRKFASFPSNSRTRRGNRQPSFLVNISQASGGMTRGYRKAFYCYSK